MSIELEHSHLRSSYVGSAMEEELDHTFGSATGSVDSSSVAVQQELALFQ